MSALSVLHSYLSSGQPWTQNLPYMQGNPALSGVCEPLSGYGSCSAYLWRWRSCSCEKQSCGTAAGWALVQERTGTCGSRMSNFRRWVDAPAQRRTCHLPAGGVPVGRCTWNYQECWYTHGHRAEGAAHTHLCLPSVQRKTSTRRRWKGQSDRKKYRREI